MSPIRRIRWNISRHAGLHDSVDSYVVSVPKSGRTWVRFFLQSYLCACDDRPFTLQHDRFANPAIPRVLFTHDLFEHVTERNLLAQLVGKQLIPHRARYTKPVLFMARDPRDVIVSRYFQLSRRQKGGKHFPGRLQEMIRDPLVGIHTIIWTMNAWLKDWSGHSNFKMIRYEDLHKDAIMYFREILAFVGVQEIDDRLLHAAADSARFENMRQLETQGAVSGGGVLRPGDPNDPESFKVRKGIVGGYKEYLDEKDLDYIASAMRMLDPGFGY